MPTDTSAPCPAKGLGLPRDRETDTTAARYSEYQSSEHSDIAKSPSGTAPSHTSLLRAQGGSARQQHRRQQSSPTASYLHLNTRLASTSPTSRGHARHPSVMGLTGDGRADRRRESAQAKLGGTSDGSPGGLSPEPAAVVRRATTCTASDTKSATTPSRFSLFSALTTRLSNQSTSVPLSDDEWIHLNIDAALCPSGMPSARDASSPAAFKSLKGTATTLLTNLQNAYRQKTIELQDVQAERSAEKEELAETQLRVRSIKMQLEMMATKAAEQEQALVELMNELSDEKRAREEDRVRHRALSTGGGSYTISEDLGVEDDERKTWRKSRETIKSEVSFDTDEESAECDSVFSRCRSPTSVMTSAPPSILDLPLTQNVGKVATLGLPPKPKSIKDMTTFQKLMKGISGETVREEDESGASSCGNCHGKSAITAWDTVSLLRDENRCLKHRVAQLEVAVEGALDVAKGIGL